MVFLKQHSKKKKKKLQQQKMLMFAFLPGRFMYIYGEAYWHWASAYLEFSVSQKQRKKHSYYSFEAFVYRKGTRLNGEKHGNCPLLAISSAFKTRMTLKES